MPSKWMNIAPSFQLQTGSMLLLKKKKKKSESPSWGLYGRHVMHLGDQDTCCHASQNSEI
jgi:hypothetical protein